MVEATGCGCPVDTSVHSTEALTEAAAESGCLVDTSVQSTEALTEAGAESGCPVDTSVQSTEAPTEAADETLNQFAQTSFACPLAVPKGHYGLGRL